MGEQTLERQVLLAHSLGNFILAILHGFFAAFLLEPLTNLVACPRGLNNVAGLQLRIQWYQASVNPGAHGPVAHLGVYRISKVNRSSALGKGNHVALRGKDIDFGATDFKP